MPDDLKPVLARQMEVYAGLHGAHRPPRRAADRRPRGPRRPRRHAGLLHHRRQRRLGRGHAATARFNELIVLNGAAALETTEFMAVADRRVRHARGLQPLRGRLGARDGHALPVDQAGRLALGRHAQRHDRPLAERHQGQGRDAQPVPPRHRRRADRPRGRRPARADRSSTASSRRRSRASRWPTPSTTPTAADRHTTAVLRDVRQPRHLPPGLDRGHPAQHAVGHGARCRPSTTTSGSCTGPTTGRRRTTSPPSSRRSCAELQRLFLIEAGKYNVLPLDDRRVERFNPDLAGPAAAHPAATASSCSAAWAG